MADMYSQSDSTPSAEELDTYEFYVAYTYMQRLLVSINSGIIKMQARKPTSNSSEEWNIWAEDMHNRINQRKAVTTQIAKELDDEMNAYWLQHPTTPPVYSKKDACDRLRTMPPL